jgi:hypothetical protein
MEKLKKEKEKTMSFTIYWPGKDFGVIVKFEG